MNREDIIRMARESGYSHSEAVDLDFDRLKRFAEIIAKAAIFDDLLWQAETETAVLREREEIAKFIEGTRLGSLPEDVATHYARLLGSCATAIRARGNT